MNGSINTGASTRKIYHENRLTNFLPYFLGRLELIEFQAVLLEIFEKRTAGQAPSEILEDYQSSHFQPSELEDQQDILEFNLLFLKTLSPRFKAVELSPLVPLGTNSVLTGISQNDVSSGSHGGEIISDAAVALALEAAKRRKELLAKNQKNPTRVDLCTSHRVFKVESSPPVFFRQHFRRFGMCTAGRNTDNNNETFLVEAAGRHIRAYLDFLRVLDKTGFSIGDIEVHFSDIRIFEKIIAHYRIEKDIMRDIQNRDFQFFFEDGYCDVMPIVEKMAHYVTGTFFDEIKESRDFLGKLDETLVAELRRDYPEVRFAFDLDRKTGIEYYSDFCFRVFGKNSAGTRLQFADGGVTDWTRKLLENREEVLMISTFDADVVQKWFRSGAVTEKANQDF